MDINLDNLKQPESIKKKIIEEFNNIQKMLNFSNLADDLFKRWYIDGRIYYHVIVNDTAPKEGIQELRYIDPRKIRKVREVKKERDPKTGADIIKSIAEYYVYFVVLVDIFEETVVPIYKPYHPIARSLSSINNRRHQSYHL